MCTKVYLDCKQEYTKGEPCDASQQAGLGVCLGHYPQDFGAIY